RHRVEDVGDLLLLEGLHEVEQRLVVELGQDLAGLLAAEQPEERHAALLGRLGQQAGDVGGVSLGQARAQLVVAPLVEELAQGVDEPRAVVHGGHYAAAPRARVLRCRGAAQWPCRKGRCMKSVNPLTVSSVPKEARTVENQNIGRWL